MSQIKKNYIIPIIIFTYLAGAWNASAVETSSEASVENPNQGLEIINPFMNPSETPKIPSPNFNIPFFKKDLKINQLFDQIQNMIEGAFKNLLNQGTKNLSDQVKNEAGKEIVKQKSVFYKGFYKTLDNIKKIIEDIKNYIQNIFQEAKWKLFLTPRY